MALFTSILEGATPTHKHDCEECIFVGTVYDEERTDDLYYCEQSCKDPTVVRRWSSDGPHYSSNWPRARYWGVATNDATTWVVVTLLNRGITIRS